MDAQKITFYNEISLMMFGFGDSHKPNPETVRLVENIVLKQLRTIVQEGLKFSSDRKTLEGEHLLFLMRHNKFKMKRFVKYLNNKHMKNVVQAMQSNVIEIDPEVKPKGRLLQFIEQIDETGEYTDLTDIDEVKLERQLRADRISLSLDEKKYIQFSKARTASFHSRDITYRNLEKLKLWIDPKGIVEFKLEALEVISYFAYETVAEITDYALLVRMDAKCNYDPLSHLYGSYYTATMFNGEHRFSGTNLDYSRVYSGQPSISVNEIKEVMRRVHSPQAGSLNFGGKLPETHYLFAL